MTPGQDPDLGRRKLTDAALVLPVAGTFLLMPPFIQVFVADGTIAGIPVIVAYMFAVWFALVAIAWRFAAPLRRTMQADPPSSPETETRAGELPEA